MKEVLELDSILRSDLNIFNKIYTYFKIKLLSHKIKKIIFKDDIITEKDLVFFIQLVNYASAYLNKFNLNDFSSWYKLIDGILGIKIFINCEPIHGVVYCGKKLNYRYEFSLKKLNNNLTSTRNIDRGIDRFSDYMYDHYVYSLIRTYITATIDVIEEIWLEML